MLCQSLAAVLHVYTLHFGALVPTSFNYGLGGEADCGGFVFQAGGFRNSFGRASLFGVAGYEVPVEPLSPDLRLGAFVGAATGYPHRALRPIAGLRVEYRLPWVWPAVSVLPPDGRESFALHFTLSFPL